MNHRAAEFPLTLPSPSGRGRIAVGALRSKRLLAQSEVRGQREGGKLQIPNPKLQRSSKSRVEGRESRAGAEGSSKSRVEGRESRAGAEGTSKSRAEGGESRAGAERKEPSRRE